MKLTTSIKKLSVSFYHSRLRQFTLRSDISGIKLPKRKRQQANLGQKIKEIIEKQGKEIRLLIENS